MPELPEVETVRRALAPHLVGARMLSVDVRSPQLRRPVPVERLKAGLPGDAIEVLDRRGKYLLATLLSGNILVIHLGMTGNLRVCPSDQPPTP